jgi:hypothetical protein
MELDIRRPQREQASGKSSRVPRRLKIVSHANSLEAKPAGFQARTAAFIVFSRNGTSAKFLKAVLESALARAAGGRIVNHAKEQNGPGGGVRNHKQERTIHNHLKSVRRFPAD